MLTETTEVLLVEAAARAEATGAVPKWAVPRPARHARHEVQPGGPDQIPAGTCRVNAQ